MGGSYLMRLSMSVIDQYPVSYLFLSSSTNTFQQVHRAPSFDMSSFSSPSSGYLSPIISRTPSQGLLLLGRLPSVPFPAYEEKFASALCALGGFFCALLRPWSLTASCTVTCCIVSPTPIAPPLRLSFSISLSRARSCKKVLNMHSPCAVSALPCLASVLAIHLELTGETRSCNSVCSILTYAYSVEQGVNGNGNGSFIHILTTPYPVPALVQNSRNYCLLYTFLFRSVACFELRPSLGGFHVSLLCSPHS